MRIIEGKIYLPPEPGHVFEPGAPRPSAHSEPQRLLSQRLEEQQQPALLLQGSSSTVSHCLRISTSPIDSVYLALKLVSILIINYLYNILICIIQLGP